MKPIENKIIDVLALGESIHEYDNANNLRIGVNDVNRWFPCQHLVVINNLSGFQADRKTYIKRTDSHVHTIQALQHEMKANINLVSVLKLTPMTSQQNKTPLTVDIDTNIYHSRTSPFVAVGLAYRFGANIIRCFGVDLVTHRAYSSGQNHTNELKSWSILLNELKKKGVSVEFPVYSKLNSV